MKHKLSRIIQHKGTPSRKRPQSPNTGRALARACIFSDMGLVQAWDMKVEENFFYNLLVAKNSLVIFILFFKILLILSCAIFILSEWWSTFIFAADYYGLAQNLKWLAEMLQVYITVKLCSGKCPAQWTCGGKWSDNLNTAENNFGATLQCLMLS